MVKKLLEAKAIALIKRIFKKETDLEELLYFVEGLKELYEEYEYEDLDD